MKDSGLVDEDVAKGLCAAADVVQNQAEAGTDTSLTDRLKMAGIAVCKIDTFFACS